MAIGNETFIRQCRFLDETCFDSLYKCFSEAFSDYIVPFALTEAQFRNHLNLTGVDLDRTVGCFDSDRLIGFSLNGFGQWNGLTTAYDAGTGVIPSFRRQGISDSMFEMMMPVFSDSGVQQFLLEVISTNRGAIRLYEKLGFQSVRGLALLQCDGDLRGSGDPELNVTIREIVEPDWEVLSTFWDGSPSWQNSPDAIHRSNKLRRILGAFLDDVCVGYVIFSLNFGRIAQFAVDKNVRRKGIGTELIKAVKAATAQGYSLQVINLDRSLTDTIQFFSSLGFYERLWQHEMVLGFGTSSNGIS